MKVLFFVLGIFLFAQHGDGTVNVGCQADFHSGHQDPEERCNEPEGHILACGGSPSHPCPAVVNINDISGDTNCGECLTLKDGTRMIHVVIVGKVNHNDEDQSHRPNNKYYLTLRGYVALTAGPAFCYDPSTQDDCPSCSQVAATESAIAKCEFGVSCLTDMENDAGLVCTDTYPHDEACGTKYNPCPVAQNVPGSPVPIDGCDECFKLETATDGIYVRLAGKVDTSDKTNRPDVKYFLSEKGLEALGASSPTCYDYDADTGTGSLVIDVSQTEPYNTCPKYGRIGCQDLMGSSTDPANQCDDEKDGDLTTCGDLTDPCPLVANIAMVEDDDDCGMCLTLETEDDTPTKKHFQILGKVNTATATNRPNNKYFTSEEGLKALGESGPSCYDVTGDTCTSCTVMNVAQEDENCDKSFSVGCQTSMAGDHLDPEGECSAGPADMGECGEDHNPCPAVAHVADLEGDKNCGECTIIKHEQKSIHIQILGKADTNDNRPRRKYYLSPKGMEALGVSSAICYDMTTEAVCHDCTLLEGVREMSDIATCKFPVACFVDMERDGSAVCTGTDAHDNDCGTKFNPCPVSMNAGTASPGTDGCDECFKLKKGTEEEIYVRFVGKADTSGKTAPKAKYFVSSAALVKLGASASPTCYDYVNDIPASPTLVTDVEESDDFDTCPDYLDIGCQTTMGADSDPEGACSQPEGDIRTCGGDGQQRCPLVANQGIISGSDRCGECMTLEAEDATAINAEIIGKVVVSGNRPVNKYYTSPAGLTALGGGSSPSCYQMSDDSCNSCTQMHVVEKAVSCPGALSVGCQTTMTEADVDPEEECSEGAGHLLTCGEDFNPCPAIANINDIPGGTSCGECIKLTKSSETIHIQILGKADDNESGMNRPDYKYYLSSEGLKKLGVTTPVCYDIATRQCTGGATCSSVTDWSEAAGAACTFQVGCLDEMEGNHDPADQCTDLTAHDKTCGSKFNPCPATRNIIGSSEGDGCDECFTIKKGDTEIYTHLMGKIDLDGKTNAPKVKYFLSKLGLTALDGTAPTTCYVLADDTDNTDTAEGIVEGTASDTCPNYLDIGCQTTMGTDTDPADACTDQDDGVLTACGTGDNPPCPIVANQANVAGSDKCGQCLELETEQGTKVKAEVLGKVALGSSNRPVNKYYTSPAGVMALGGGSSPSCYDVSADSCTSCTQMHIAEKEESCDGQSITIGCQTSMIEADVDPEGKCDEGAGHLETCGDDFNPCPAAANINDISGGTGCGECVVLTNGEDTVHIQILGKATDVGNNRPDHKYYLSPAGLTKLGQKDPVCYEVTSGKCTDDATCSSVSGWTEAGPATCKFGISCIDDMTTNKDPANSCSELTAHDNTCGTSDAPCPATRNIAGFGGAQGCDECLKVKKDETELHIHVMGKVDITDKTNAPKAKYFLSSAGLVALGQATPTCHKVDDTQSDVSMLTDVTETSKSDDCRDGATIGCQTTMGTDTDPEDQCKGQGEGDLEACGQEATPCPLIANIEAVGTDQRCGECLTLENTSGTKIHAEILGKAKVEGNRPENKYYTSPEGLKALGVSDPTCYLKATDGECGSCSQVKVAEGDATCPTRTTPATTTTRPGTAGATRQSVAFAALAAAAFYVFIL